MPFLFIFAILLAFPFVELYVLIRLGGIYGWWLGFYLLMMAMGGWLLIQEEKLAVFARLFQVAQSGGHPARALFATARRLIAGVLLIFPGVISDAIAVLLLLIPTEAAMKVNPQQPKAANDDVIEGEWRRED